MLARSLVRSLASLRKSRAYVLRAPYTGRHFPSFALRAVSLAEACDRPAKHLKRPRISPLRLPPCQVLISAFASQLSTLPPATRERERDSFHLLASRAFYQSVASASRCRRASSIYICNFCVCRSRIRRTPATRARDAHIKFRIRVFLHATVFASAVWLLDERRNEARLMLVDTTRVEDGGCT